VSRTILADERDDVQHSKHHPDGPGLSCSIPFGWPAERLTEGLQGELTVVCAPAGFGKTALLADWTRRGGRTVAWLSLDTADNDAVRFWRHAAAAIGMAGPGTQPAELLRSPCSPQAVVATLVNELAAAPGEVTLVLDDYHLIESQPVHRSLGLLLGHLPAGLRLVVASRSDPPLPLARLRARGQLTEIRAAELRFTREEAAALLRTAAGRDLPESAVAGLVIRTEGWAAGLQLAALSLRGREDVAGFVASFSGDHRYVLDYLAEEVLERQPERLRGFLLETSVLDRLCGPLCDAITGGTDGQRLLEAVERANLFLTPLDEVRGWWRYHQLFADLLRARLAQERPERLPRLHGAAAAWLDGHGLVDHAIQHALLAGDTTAAAELVERNIEPMLGRGETTRWRATRPAEPDQGPTLAGDQGATVTGWLDALPADVVQSRPRLCAIRAILAVIAGQGGELEHWVDTAERALAAASTEEPIGSGSDQVGWAGSPLADMPGTIAILRADLARLRGDADTAIRLTRQLVSRLAPAERVLRFNAEWNLARANWVNGDLSRAEQALAELIAAARVAGEHYLILTVCWELGRVQRARGRLGAALATYRQALGIGTELGSPALPALGIARLGVAAVLYERGELTTAPEDSPSYAREPEHLMLARVLLSQGEPGRACRLLERLRAAAAAQQRTGSLIELGPLRARALAASGDQADALAALAEAVTLAWPEGYLRVFTGEGAALSTLLDQLIAARRRGVALAAGVPWAYLGQLRGTLTPGEGGAALPPASAVPGTAGLAEPLTSRELEVLSLLGVGMANQQIARELVVAPETAKKHVSHILGKLGAANRTQAAARARALGLLRAMHRRAATRSVVIRQARRGGRQ